MNNKVKSNPEKFHLLSSSNDELKICVNDDVINTIKYEKLLGVMIDSIFNLNTYCNAILEKVGQISALPRITPFMSFQEGGS